MTSLIYNDFLLLQDQGPTLLGTGVPCFDWSAQPLKELLRLCHGPFFLGLNIDAGGAN